MRSRVPAPRRALWQRCSSQCLGIWGLHHGSLHRPGVSGAAALGAAAAVAHDGRLAKSEPGKRFCLSPVFGILGPMSLPTSGTYHVASSRATSAVSRRMYPLRWLPVHVRAGCCLNFGACAARSWWFQLPMLEQLLSVHAERLPRRR